MAYIAEQFDSRNGHETLDEAEVRLVYRIADAASEAEAVGLAASEAPATVSTPITGQTLVLVRWEWEIDEAELYTVTANYGPRKPSEFDFSFDTAGGQEHITQSLQTVSRYPAGAPDQKGAIGVTQGSVEGCDVPVATFKWTETHVMPIAAFTFAYAHVLASLTNTINQGVFRGYAAEQVLFRGVQGGKKSEDTAALTFSFEAGPHRTGLACGDITGISKKAWQYLWVLYNETEDSAAKSIVRTPKAVYVEEVFYKSDFSLLGIGVDVPS